jgi:pilus assembly protein FimV
MHSTHRLPLKSSALKKLTAAVASAMVLTSAAHAAGLGKLTVLSALGQPLRAEIELTSVSPEEASGLVARLASPDAFKTANIEFNPALLSLRFTVEQRGGRQFIRVSSSQPLNEPFVDMLLELSWNNGRLVREYTFLLDPAELRATQSAQVAPGESAAQPRARLDAAPAASPAPAAERPRRGRESARDRDRNAEEGERTRIAAASASKYRVKPGDSLGKIAAQLKPVDVSLDMMLVALYRANPDAFMGNNMNRLKSGRILSVPGTEAVRATGETEAHGVVVAHAADFNAYRNKLAGQVGAVEAEKTPQAGQSAAGKITAKVEERPTAANESQDQLRLSRAAPNAPAGKGTTMSTEDTIAKQKELEDAQARVKELERNVSELEKLATVKNKSGAEAQSNASTPAVAGAPAAVLDKPATPKPESKKLPTIKPAPKPAKPEPGLLDFIMDNLTYLGAGAAVVLLAALGIARRRKKQAVKAVGEPSILGVPAEPAHSLFAETGGQSVDTNNSVFNSSFAPSASQLDTNEVDPVAEADVYIAYGRDAQAEEILKEALRTHPERLPVRLKLLEIYASRKDQRAFETQAGEVYGMTRGQGDEWAQAAALGLSIDPLNPLYAHSAAPAEPVTAPQAASQNLMSRELDDAFGAAADSHEQQRAPLSFDQHFAEAMGTAQPAAQSAESEPAAAFAAAEPAKAHDDDHVLDFDLGGLSFEPVTPAEPAPELKPAVAANEVPDLEFDMGAFDVTPAPAAVAVPAADEPLDFSFDMDFGTPTTPNPVPQLDPDALDDLFIDRTAAPAPTVSAEGPNTDIDMASLAREFDLPDLPTELHEGIPALPEQTAPATELKDPLFDLDTMDFGLDDEVPHGARPAEPAPALSLSLDDDPFALPELPTATPAPATAAYALDDVIEPHVTESGLDISGFDTGSFDKGGFDAVGIDLDLPADSPLPLPEVETVASPVPTTELSPAHMEMETKLDLAIAYQEIGDKEGARELLDEVIKGGSSDQASRANAMRAALA